MTAKTIWTIDMETRLAGMKRAGMTVSAIAAKLGVSENAVKHKARALGAYVRVDHSKGRFGPSRDK